MEQIYRKKSLERIESPENLDQYLRVTGPSVWMILAAVIVLLAGLLIWSTTASIESYVKAQATVENGVMTLQFEDPEASEKVEAGMIVRTGSDEAEINIVGRQPDGNFFASALCEIPDGTYDVKVIYNTTQVLRLLLN